MTSITLQEAQENLPEVLGRLHPGEEVVIVDGGTAVAMVRKAERTSWPCKAGSAAQSILWIAPDFDAPLEDFRECADVKLDL